LVKYESEAPRTGPLRALIQQHESRMTNIFITANSGQSSDAHLPHSTIGKQCNLFSRTLSP
jgi:hypothetical protein